MTSATVIIPSVRGGVQLERLLGSLAAQSLSSQIIVVDDGSVGGVVRSAAESFDVDLIRLDTNLGFSRAINIAARQAKGETLLLLNDDCRADPTFVEEMVKAVGESPGTVMAAGVLRDREDPALIDTAGIELDPTLLVFDYLHGAPISRLDGDVEDPVGPCGAAAAFDRTAFLAVGGFDERLFAYWEDVDLALRLRRRGGRCVLARYARGVHDHSATLGSGSARKNYLVGFGRGYVLRKWGALTPALAPRILARDLVICAGQAIVDRNVAGARGRVDGLRATNRQAPFPVGVTSSRAETSAFGTLLRRARRRSRLRRRARS